MANSSAAPPKATGSRALIPNSRLRRTCAPAAPAELMAGGLAYQEIVLVGNLEAGRVQRLRGTDPGAVLAEHPALAEQHDRAVRERGQVARGAERAVLRHPRGDVVVEQVGEALS